MNDATRDTWTKISDTAALMKVASNHLWVCNDAAKNFVVYIDKKDKAFGGFTGFITSFF